VAINMIFNKSDTRASVTHDALRRKNGFSVIELIVVLAIIGILVALMLPAIRSAGPAARRTQCKNNLKQIVLALLNYESTYHALPPAYTVDASGRPLHSWRTLILPFVEQKELYKKIDLSKAWNDPANAAAFKAHVITYSCPDASCPENQTTYLAIVTPKSCLQPGKPRPLSEITREHGKPLIVIEVDSKHAVPWMAPQDADEELLLSLGPNTGLPHADGMHAAFVDGSAYFLNSNLSPAERLALIPIDDINK
jgi:prepilin-type N-terminal cleavage/methylation domain-containing protein